ncbi:unnamed protein product [Clonostachys solani]|uniref:Uncharacterized protein n=1 Tax=Clonostachys solani TaxID=160281 RepID=A0A9N9W207_9HYPO|nr:unnamed protein product [Clonostachys solani]
MNIRNLCRHGTNSFTPFLHKKTSEVDAYDVMSAAEQAEQMCPWPSDSARHNTLAATRKELPFKSSETMEISQGTLTIHCNLRGQTKIGQHRPSTFRLLCCIMMRCHEAVFNGDFSSDPDSRFWEALYVGSLDDSWHVQDCARLKQRFEWILEFIREGRLPMEAQTAKNILKNALACGVLSSSSHPYGYDGNQAKQNYLNPDLCPGWIKSFLAADGSLSQIEKEMKCRMKDIGIHGFCNQYSILIAQLWEESMFSTPSQGAAQSWPTASTHDAIVHSAATNDTTARDSDTSDCSGSPDQDLPPLSQSVEPEGPPLLTPDETPEGATVRWSANEDDFLRKLLKLDIPWPERKRRFQEEFGPLRSTNSLKMRAKRVEKDFVRMQNSWTDHEKNSLRSLIETEESWDNVIRKFEEKFNTKRSRMAMTHVAMREKWDTTRLVSQNPYSEDQDAFIASLRTENVSKERWPTLFLEKFGFSRTKAALQRRAGVLGVNNEIRNKLPWSSEETKFLETLMDSEIDNDEILQRFWREYGQERSQRSIIGKLEHTKNVQKRSTKPRSRVIWSKAEEDFVRAWSGTRKDLTSELNAKFGSNRIRRAVSDKVRALGRGNKNKTNDRAGEDTKDSTMEECVDEEERTGLY